MPTRKTLKPERYTKSKAARFRAATAGMTNEQAAECLGMSMNTLKKLRKGIVNPSLGGFVQLWALPLAEAIHAGEAEPVKAPE